jgi:tetratricopeptide (TPR) repeat protein
MAHVRSRRILGVVVFMAAACVGPEETESPRVPPLPDGLALAEATVRRDLETRHGQLASAAANPDSTRASLAGRFGELGISLLAHGFFVDAAESLRRASELAPSELRWHYYLGQAIRRTGDMGAAADAFLGALALDENNLPARLWLAETRLAREELDEAEAAFHRSLELRAHCPQAWTGLGRISLSRGDYAEALESLETALEQQPESARARYSMALALRGLGRTGEAREELARLAGEDHSLILTCFEDPLMREVRRRQTGTRGHEERALRAIEERRPEAALVELRAAVRANPNRFPARYDIANLLSQMGRVDEARDELRSLLAIRPDYAAALSMLAGIEARAGRWPEAEALLERAVAADPESESVRLDSARILHSARRTSEALAAYEHALRISPTVVPAILGLAVCLAELDRLEEALEKLERRSAELPSRPAIALGRALLLLTTGEEADAADALTLTRTVFGSHPTSGAALVLAAALSRSGHPTEAADWRSRALDAMPDHPIWADRRERAQRLLEDAGAGRLGASSLDPAALALLTLEDPLPTTDELSGEPR